MSTYRGVNARLAGEGPSRGLLCDCETGDHDDNVVSVDECERVVV